MMIFKVPSFPPKAQGKGKSQEPWGFWTSRGWLVKSAKLRIRSGMKFTEMESKTSLKVLYNKVFTLVKWKWKLLSHVWLFVTPWNSPGQNTGVGSLCLLQGIFPTQGLNPGLPHCRWILYHLSHKASPRILEWVAYPFSSSSSQPKNQTGVLCITGRFFTNWAMREALIFILDPCKCFT